MYVINYQNFHLFLYFDYEKVNLWDELKLMWLLIGKLLGNVSGANLGSETRPPEAMGY